MTELRVVPLHAFHDRVSMAVAVAAVERGFRALAAGEADLPDPLVAERRVPSAGSPKPSAAAPL